MMKNLLKLIDEYKTTRNKKAYLFVIFEKSKEIQFPTYSLFQLLNTISDRPHEIISSEGWTEKDLGLHHKRKIIEEEKEALKKVTAEFEKNKKEVLFLRKKYLLIPTIIAFILLVIFAIIPLNKSIKENKVWEISKKENTIMSYYRYIDSYPDGKHINEALMKMDLAKKKKEEVIWEKVLKKNTKKNYLEYINKYNNKDATYYSEAKRKIDEIDWNEAFKKKNSSILSTHYSSNKNKAITLISGESFNKGKYSDFPITKNLIPKLPMAIEISFDINSTNGVYNLWRYGTTKITSQAHVIRGNLSVDFRDGRTNKIIGGRVLTCKISNGYHNVILSYDGFRSKLILDSEIVDSVIGKREISNYDGKIWVGRNGNAYHPNYLNGTVSLFKIHFGNIP